MIHKYCRWLWNSWFNFQPAIFGNFLLIKFSALWHYLLTVTLPAPSLKHTARPFTYLTTLWPPFAYLINVEKNVFFRIVTYKSSMTPFRIIPDPRNLLFPFSVWKFGLCFWILDRSIWEKTVYFKAKGFIMTYNYIKLSVSAELLAIGWKKL